MSNYRVTLFKQRADAAAAKAREVAEKAAAENRPMTAAERSVYDDNMHELSKCLDGVKAARADISQEQAIRAELGGTAVKAGRRLSFKGMAGGIANRMLTGDMGAKALAPSGAAVVAQGFTEDPVALGRAATGLLDALPVQVQTSAEYAFLRQSTRTNNAAVVDEGDAKPESVIGLTRVDQSLAVVAHLSEGIPRYWLADTSALEQFVATELEFGLAKAVEAKV